MIPSVSNTQNLSILYEDDHLLAINKRTGDLVQGNKTGDTPLGEMVKAYLKETYQKPGDVFLGVTHRLDRPVTGVTLFAKTSRALARVNALFAARDTQKIYWALVKNTPPQERDTLTHWLVHHKAQNKSHAHNTAIKNSKKAVLEYTVLKKLRHYYLLEIRLHTGRHHQIRCQLAAMSCPVKGDIKYGAERSNPNGGIHLHAKELHFIHPVKKEKISLTAPLPQDPLWDACCE